ncbi:GntR family transcriptional regulator [Victivallaceae bacterium BBE-744-WT-12]|uniref:GntR family transcriptional regulator n=1 Tax=Victivallis lenta TaxID=2606640 RepID=A0A844G6R0_9BACT|nr:GntR family transcriptional regulator [Victivallis lenta]MST99537.1 GntR family transcriptional regulator [Victivallis lenta]
MRRKMQIKRYDDLHGYLWTKIASGEFPEHSRLPSFRQLAARFGVSQGSVQRCIRDLEEDGLLTAVHGSGVFVQSPPRLLYGSGTRCIAVRLERNPARMQTYCSLVLQGIQQATNNRNCRLELDYRLAQQPPESPPDHYDGLILLGTNFETAPLIRHYPYPVVGVEMNRRPEEAISTLALDPFLAAELAVEYFRARGLTRVEVLTPDSALHRDRAEIFKSRWSRYGSAAITVLGLADIPVFLPQSDRAYYLCNGDLYQRWAFGVQREGIRLSQYANIVSVDGKPLLIAGREPGIVILPDWEEVGRAALEELFRRLESAADMPRKIYFSCTLRFPQTA